MAPCSRESAAAPRGLLARESQLLLYELSDVLDRGTATLRSVLLGILEAGAAAGEIRADLECEPMADFLTEVCEGFANRLISKGAGRRDALLIDAVVEIALNGVVASPGPGAETRSRRLAPWSSES